MAGNSGGCQFSVIIPWHGNKEHLLRAMASLDAQTERDFELLIVCNGNAVGMVEELRQWKELPPCHVLASPPADANRARNAGIDSAKGKWLALLDADDEFTPDKLASMRKAIAAGDSAIFLSLGTRVRGPGKTSVFPHSLLGPDENMAEFFFSRGCNCSTTAIVVRADVARNVRFTPGLPKFQDNDFLIRAQAAGEKICMVNNPLFLWHDASETGRISRGGNYEQQMAWAKSLAPAFTKKAFHAFCVRRVAQYVFPRDPVRNLQRFWNGWRHGGISAKETALMMFRAILPSGLARRGVSFYSWLTQPTGGQAGRNHG
jgi:glycosyltransferase involved in cell wall biosynthesis